MSAPTASSRHPVLRHRDGHHARVTYEELFFDLIYVFAVTQLSHQLLHNLSLTGLAQSLILWFAVWLGWQYTCWMTNWFDPETPRIRALMFVMMLVALVMAAAIPHAFGERVWVFAVAYVTIQVGRTVYLLCELGRDHPLSANYRRMVGWLSISAVFWLAGAWAGPTWRLPLWLVAVMCEYFSPMIGFALPGLGRSRTNEWTIEGGHMAERCQLFVIVALGETLLATGATLGDAETWGGSMLSAMLATFLGTLAMWWLYFGTSSKEASARITESDDPGRMGAYFHYVHVILIAGIIGTAVGNDLAVAHPQDASKLPYALALCAGPAIYLLGSAMYKKVVYGRVPKSHLLGMVLLLGLLPFASMMNLLTLSWLTTLVMLALGLWEGRAMRQRTQLSLGAN